MKTMNKKGSKMTLLGLAMCVAAVVPAAIWLVNLLTGRTTDPELLFAAIPCECLGMYLTAKGCEEKAMAEA